MRIAIVDGDMVAYRNSVAVEEKIDFGDGEEPFRKTSPSLAKTRMDNFLSGLMETLKLDELFVALSDEPSFRVGVFPAYKIARADKEYPLCLAECKQHLLDKYNAVKRPGFEADDIMGIRATNPKYKDHKQVIVSIDKDMKQIPGWFYNPFPRTGEPKAINITKQAADTWFMYQTLVGDDCDGYPGCKGIGPKKAEKLLAEAGGDLGRMWATVLKAFISRGFTEQDALVQARVARICRYSDWSATEGVTLWNPPQSQASLV